MRSLSGLGIVQVVVAAVVVVVPRPYQLLTREIHVIPASTHATEKKAITTSS